MNDKDVWVWVSHDAEGLARGSREHVETERDAYERECRERGIVPAVTYIDISGPAAPPPTALPLAEFLLARIAEDEAVAHGACRWHGRVWHTDDTGCCVQDLGPETTVAEQTRTSGAHIARFGPARVLAECEAKRKIVELHHRNGYQPTQCAACGYAEDWEVHENGPTYPCDALKTLARIYADHPDYREDWDERAPEEAPNDHLPPRLAAH